MKMVRSQGRIEFASKDVRSAGNGLNTRMHNTRIALAHELSIRGADPQPDSAERRLQQLGIALLVFPTRLVHTSRRSSQAACFFSGMLPIKDGKPPYVGRLGKELDADAGRDALRTATLNALSAAKEHLGSLDRVTLGIVVRVYLAASAHTDVNQPIVADAASALLRDVFGENKISVRSVIGVISLPLGLPVTLELTFEVNNWDQDLIPEKEVNDNHRYSNKVIIEVPMEDMQFCQAIDQP
ncbi:RidA family protein [Tunturiibacter gelidiferens]|uniref:RidA family protein n=1 Tax=Tunturiibacter gelidiferens TaxID=3069689 RepID=UPI003D9B73F5